MQLPSQHDGPEGGNIHAPVCRIMLMLLISTWRPVFPVPLLVLTFDSDKSFPDAIT